MSVIISKYDALKVREVGRPLLYDDLKEGAAHAPTPYEAVIFILESKAGVTATDQADAVINQTQEGQSLINDAPLFEVLDLLSRTSILSHRALYAVPKARLRELAAPAPRMAGPTPR